MRINSGWSYFRLSPIVYAQSHSLVSAVTAGTAYPDSSMSRRQASAMSNDFIGKS